jgi:hypothetical protein
MRSVVWLFFVSVLLFISGIGFVIAAGRTVKFAPQAEAPAVSAAPPVATVRHVMAGITMPAAQFVWDSVSTIVDDKGVTENVPRTDDEWAKVAANAAVLTESANMLTAGGRAIDTGDWVKFATALADSGKKALGAAEKKDVEGILAVGEEINRSCDACHERYLRQ